MEIREKNELKPRKTEIATKIIGDLDNALNELDMIWCKEINTSRKAPWLCFNTLNQFGILKHNSMVFLY